MTKFTKYVGDDRNDDIPVDIIVRAEYTESKERNISKKKPVTKASSATSKKKSVGSVTIKTKPGKIN